LCAYTEPIHSVKHNNTVSTDTALLKISRVAKHVSMNSTQYHSKSNKLILTYLIKLSGSSSLYRTYRMPILSDQLSFSLPLTTLITQTIAAKRLAHTHTEIAERHDKLR